MHARNSASETQKPVQLLMIICSSFAIAMAIIQAYGNRAHIYQTDAISYLDISDLVLNGRYSEVVNAHWSPLYPCIIAIVRSVFGTDAQFETSALKIANFINFILLLGAFNWFLPLFLQLVEQNAQRETVKIPPVVMAITLYLCFTWCALTLSGIYVDTPDVLAFASIIASTAIIFRLQNGSAKLSDGALLGLILGLGFLAKAAVLPAALIFFGIVLLSRGTNLRRRVNLLGMALTFFILLAAPWIYLLSKQVGHLSFSESSWFAYITYVQNTSHFLRPSLPETLFLHPARILCKAPTTLEFATPIGGTYPLFTDPIYWNQGIKIQASFRLVPQILTNILFYCLLIGLPVAAYFLQFIISSPRLYPLRCLKQTWFLWLIACAGLAMYLFAIPMILIGESRYVAPYILLLLAALLASLSIKKEGRGRIVLIATWLMVIAWPLLDTMQEIRTDLKLATVTPSFRYWRVAQALKSLGVIPGSRVAILQDAQHEGWYRCTLIAPRLENVQNAFYYWARLAHLKVVAHISPPGTPKSDPGFWNCTNEQREALCRKLADLGVVAIIYNPSNDFDQLQSGNRSQPEDLVNTWQKKTPAFPPGWRELDHLHCYVYLLNARDKNN